MINETNVYRLNTKGDAKFLTFKAFEKLPHLSHVFTTRIGGVSSGCCQSWNFGFPNELDSMENRMENCKILADVMNITLDDFVWTNQTHTDNIRLVTKDDCGKGITRHRDYEDIDGLITNVKGLALVTIHADCNAIYFYDPVTSSIGLAHSGWKGTLYGIAAKMVSKLIDSFGVDPSNLVVGIGPSLCQDCFQVDHDVAAAFIDRDSSYDNFIYHLDSKSYIDLWEINKQLLTCAGVLPPNIHCMELCTKENPDMFFSHRFQNGKRGLMAASIMIK
ncbi:MAG: peptidoglycan editing factor PgeF [Anaerovoracaceae bacterium]